ncbi:MAG: hypothetical protein NTU51_06835 [Bacteroidetes bacterium]|nr:hypothetical protein [Bacteroidota bacterium]
MSKESQISHSFYESAPELLLDKIAEVNSILAKQKAKTGVTESYRFWTHVADVMKFAWDYTQDIQWILRKNQILEAESKFLKDWNIQLVKRLEAYELVREMKINGRFEEIVRSVDEMLIRKDEQMNHFKPTMTDE